MPCITFFFALREKVFTLKLSADYLAYLGYEHRIKLKLLLFI